MLKIISSETFLRAIPHKVGKYFLATSAQAHDTKMHRFRTNESNPENHTSQQIGQYYEIPASVKQQLFLYGGIPKSYETQIKTFTEACLMIREPSVDIINCLKTMDFSNPIVKFVLYGKKGSGKSLVLAHVVHYCFNANYLLVHVPWVGSWMRRCKESSNSATKEGCIDLNLDAAAWLKHFKNQNAHLLKTPDLKTSKEYVWSKREVTKQDAPLLELIDYGIGRIKYASDCVVALAEEIKRLSNESKCKTLVGIDGYNAFFYPNTRVYTEKKEVVHPSKIVLTEAFVNLTKTDWNNAVCVVTVDEIAMKDEDQMSYLPRFLLRHDGFEHLDPFVPISVPGYSPKEFTSCMDYYRERRWVQPLPGLDEELTFLSASNPYKLMELCGPL